MTLDLGLYRKMSRIDRRGMHDIHERLKEMRYDLKKWTAGGRGMLRLSPDDVMARDQAWMQAMQERTEEPPAAVESEDDGD